MHAINTCSGGRNKSDHSLGSGGGDGNGELHEGPLRLYFSPIWGQFQHTSPTHHILYLGLPYTHHLSLPLPESEDGHGGGKLTLDTARAVRSGGAWHGRGGFPGPS